MKSGNYILAAVIFFLLTGVLIFNGCTSTGTLFNFRSPGGVEAALKKLISIMI